jgi:hypothetical protein
MEAKSWVNKVIELANANPEPSEPGREYAPDSFAQIVRNECAGCGATEVCRSVEYNCLKGWARLIWKGKIIKACPKCADTLKMAKKEQDRKYREVRDGYAKERRQAEEFMRKWELANPRPTAGRAPFKETFVRKSVCGRCETVHEAEAPLHAMPGVPNGWKHSEDDGRGVIVCPKCFEETASMRAEIADWKARRGSEVGGEFRKLNNPVVPDLVLPESWRS